MGASETTWRYAHIAVNRLVNAGVPVVAFGKKEGRIGDVVIVNELPDDKDIHTVTMYLNPQHQENFKERLLAMNPERVIFNPGVENEEFEQILSKEGVEVLNACTLVMLSIGQF